jgi:hypothetical protein
MVIFTLAYGSTIRNIVDVVRTVLAFIFGRTLYTVHYQLTNPSFQVFRRTKVCSKYYYYPFLEYPITFPSQRPSSRPHPNEADDLLNMSVYHT